MLIPASMRLLAWTSFASVALCACASHAPRATGATTSVRVTAPRQALATPRCPPEPGGHVIAQLSWPLPAGRLVLTGTQRGTVQSDATFALLDATLHLVSDAHCLIGSAPVGELTVAADEPTDPDEDNPARIERVRLPHGTAAGDRDVALLYLTRELPEGTDEFVVPVVVRADGIVAGERVRIRADAMVPPQFAGEVAAAADGTLVVTREGTGAFASRVVLRADATGRFVAREEPSSPRTGEVAESTRDGHDPAHAIRVCREMGAQDHLVRRFACAGGERPILSIATAVQARAGTATGADDGHLLEVYVVPCADGARRVFFDLAHCER